MLVGKSWSRHGRPPPVARQPRTLADLTKDQSERARLRAAHVLEAETGFREGHPARALHDSALGRISAAAHRNGLMLGAHGGEPSTARWFADRGFTCTAWATDIWMVQTGAGAVFVKADEP